MLLRSLDRVIHAFLQVLLAHFMILLHLLELLLQLGFLCLKL